jgi:hypothetical protein
MSNYTPITDFSAKDALTTGDPEKLILGADIDAELSAIQTAVNSKYDSSSLASSAQAQAETDNTVLMTPLRVANWSDANAGMVGFIHAFTDPGADSIIGWDDSASAAIQFSLGLGLTTDDTTLQQDINGLTEITSLADADEFVVYDASNTALRKITRANFQNSESETKQKTALTQRNTTTTLTDDPHLAGFSLEANTTYQIEGVLSVSAGSATPDLKMMIVCDEVAQHSSIGVTRTSSGGNFDSDWANESVNIIVDLAGLDSGDVHIRGYITTHASNPTTMDLQWAQNTSDAADITMRIGSWLRATKIGAIS